MKQSALLIVFVFAQPVFAESWLCLPKVGAFITMSTPFKSGVANTPEKYLLRKNTENKWILSEFGESGSGVFMRCEEKEVNFICKRGNFDMFNLLKQEKNFQMSTMSVLGETERWTIFTYAGKCEQL